MIEDLSGVRKQCVVPCAALGSHNSDCDPACSLVALIVPQCLLKADLNCSLSTGLFHEGDDVVYLKLVSVRDVNLFNRLASLLLLASQ